MQNLNQMTLIGIVIVLAFLLGVGIVVLLTPSARSSRDALRRGITEQSKHYVETLGTKPFETLTTAQQLLLLHAYANLGKHKTVIQRAETMMDAFRQLAPERKEAFGEIVVEAYRHLGREQDAVTFRQQVGF
jgi:hypothetical protein